MKKLLNVIMSGLLSSAILSASTLSSFAFFPTQVYAEQVTQTTDLSSSDAWRIGHYSKNGVYSSWPSYICTNETFEGKENATITVNCGTSRRMELCFLGEDDASLGTISLNDGESTTLPEGIKTFKISMFNPSDYDLGYKTWKDKMFSDGREYSFDMTFEEEVPAEEPAPEVTENTGEETDPNTTVLDLSNSDLWRIGHYSKTGAYSSWPSYICLKEPVEVSEDSIIVVTCGKSRRMELSFVDSDNNSLENKSLNDGNQILAPEGTSKCYVSMCNPNDYNLGYKTWVEKIFSSGYTYKLSITKPNVIVNDNPVNPSSDDVVDDVPTNIKDITSSKIISNITVGWNLGNSLDSHYGTPNGTAKLGQETVWGNPMVTQELIDTVAAQGFNTIRIPVSWYYHTGTDENGKIYINEEWLARVKEVVDYACKNNMYVFLNSHHDQPIFYAGTSDDNFMQVQENIRLIWTQIAEYFKDYDEHLIFESFNEIDNVARSWNFSSEAAVQMNTMNQVFVDTVRATGSNNAYRVLMVPTLLDGYTSDFLDAFELPKDTVDGKLMVTIHNYASQVDQDVEPILTALDDFSKKIDSPIVIGECGSNTAFSPAEYRTINASNYFARAYAHGFRCIWWDNGSNYKLIDRKTLETNDELINAVINSEPYTNGDKATYMFYSDFLYKTIKQSTGAVVDDKYWGSTIINANPQNGLDVPAGYSYMTLLLNVSGDAVKQRIHYVYFFDKNDNLLSKVNTSTGFTSKVIAIPENTSYVRIGINDSYKKTKNDEYARYFEKGYISLTVGFLK